MTAAEDPHHLDVVLELKWLHDNIYEAKVSVTITDTCYHEGDLKIGLPPGTVGIPEVLYLTYSFTHDEGKKCGQIAKIVNQTVEVPFSAGKPTVTAYAVVNGKVAGSDTKSFPRK